MSEESADAIKIVPGFDPGELELAVASDLADELEAALDQSVLKHERPIVHGDNSDLVIISIKLVTASVPAFVDALNNFMHRHDGRVFRGQTRDGRPIDASGYSAKEILTFMGEDTERDA